MSGSFRFLDEPTPEDLIRKALDRLKEGEKPQEIESIRFDFKEDSSRRGPDGERIPGDPHDNGAAKKLAKEVAAMANTHGGGALVIGVDDKSGEFVGVALEPEWLDRTIHDTIEGNVNFHIVRLARETPGSEPVPLLAIAVEESAALVRIGGKIPSRTKEGKVWLSESEARQSRDSRLGVDPSFQETVSAVSEVSQRTRETLTKLIKRFRGPRFDASSFSEILAVLGLLSNGDQKMLNQAGVLLLTNRSEHRIDYVYRPTPGATSGTERLNEADTSLVVEISEVLAAIDRHNPRTDVPVGNGAIQSFYPLPARSVREALVNAIAHREWSAPFQSHPTVVEHVGNRLQVTSPGGLVDGITVKNILTHASKPRYATLVGALQKMGLAEREGIGIDVINRDLIAIGARGPQINAQVDEVVVVLNGVEPDPTRIGFFQEVRDPHMSTEAAREDVDFALVVDRLLQPKTPWATATSVALALQRTEEESGDALDRLSRYEIAGQRVLKLVKVPKHTPPAWALEKRSLKRLGGVMRSVEMTEEAIQGWIEERGRISSSNYEALFGVSQPTATTRLKNLADSGLLLPSNASGAGQGFHYTLA